MTLDRRSFLVTLPALAMMPRVLAQSGAPPLRTNGLSQLTLAVSDIKRSLDFYQGLFGMPIQARHGGTILLRIGSGPRFLALRQAAAGESPSISAFGLGIEQFAVDRVAKVLTEHGVAAGEPLTGEAVTVPPMTYRTRSRMPDLGGAPQGTRELFVGDPSGILFQLHDVSYCGGAGALGNECRSVEASPKKGLLAVKDMSHFTIGVSDQAKTVEFYQGLFGAPIQAYQGQAPAYGIGPGVHFLMFTGGGGGGRGGARGAAAGAPGGTAGATPGGAPAAGGRDGGARAGGDGAGRGARAGGAPGAGAPGAGRGAAPRGPRIDHACLSMDNFKPDEVTKILGDYGIKPQQGQARNPLVTYISLRMPDRGGAEGGTPELYLTDPDGLAIQLQDVKYCGGGGFLGEVCAAP